MHGDLIINGKDAYAAWGVEIDEDFVSSLHSPAPLKEFIENKSRNEHGKRVIIVSPKMDERDLTLGFVIFGKTPSLFRANKDAFVAELSNGMASVSVPKRGSEVYHLVYNGNGITYAENRKGTICRFSAKFVEANPSNRV